MEQVEHPNHYGGENDPFETIKVINAWNLNFNLGYVEDLKKARFYIDYEIKRHEE